MVEKLVDRGTLSAPPQIGCPPQMDGTFGHKWSQDGRAASLTRWNRTVSIMTLSASRSTMTGSLLLGLTVLVSP